MPGTRRWLRSDGDGSLRPIELNGLRSAWVALMQVPVLHADKREAAHAAAEICAASLGDAFVVSVSMGSPAEPTMIATTSAAALRADGVQMAAAEGPAFTAWAHSRAVASDDLSTDPRWPRVARRLRTRPVHGVVAAPMRIDGDRLGVLAAYRAAPGIDAEIVTHVGTLGEAVAAIISTIELRHTATNEARTLKQAMKTRETIDLAKGIVMAQRHCDADEAFAILVGASQNTNTKLRDIAARLVREAAGGTPLSI